MFKRRRAKGGLSVSRLDKRPIAIIRPKNDAAKLKGLLCPFNFGPNGLAIILITEILIFVGAGRGTGPSEYVPHFLEAIYEDMMPRRQSEVAAIVVLQNESI